MGVNFGMEYPTISSFFEANGDFPENLDDEQPDFDGDDDWDLDGPAHVREDDGPSVDDPWWSGSRSDW